MRISDWSSDVCSSDLSLLLLREDRLDPATEVRLPLPAGCRVIVDTQRFWHAVWHRGDAPRYALITSWESGPELESFIAANSGRATVDSIPLDAAVVADAQAELLRRIEERERIFDGLFQEARKASCRERGGQDG